MTAIVSEPRAAREAAARARWSIVGLLMALCFISHMNRVSMSIAADERIMPQYGITPVQMGWVYSAFLLVYTVFMIPGGFFIDRFGPRVALAFMALGTAVVGAATGLAGLALATQLWLSLIIVRSVMGLLTTPLHPASARAVVMWLPPSRQTLVNGLVTGAALLGIACTPPLFGRLIDAIDWPAAFMVTGTCTLILGIVWWGVTRGLASGTSLSTGDGSRAWKELLTSRSLLLLTLSYAAIGYFQYLFFYWMHYYFEQVLHLGKSESRYYAALPTLAMAFTMPLGGWLSARMHARWGWRVGRCLVAGGAMLGAFVFLASGITPVGHGWTVLCFTAALGTLGLSEAVFWQTAVEVGKDHGGAAAAVMNTGGNGIGLFAPVVTPWVASKLGWQSGIALGGVVCLLGGVCWLWIRAAQGTNGGQLYEPN